MTTLAFGMPGGWEWLVIGLIGLLLFGRRLPEVGRSLGRGIVEFKRGIKGLEDEIETASSETLAGGQRPALRQAEKWEGDQVRVAQSDPAAHPATE